jgi:hypothetical protein
MTQKTERISKRKTQKIAKLRASDFAPNFVYLILAEEGGNGGRQINIGLGCVCVCVWRDGQWALETDGKVPAQREEDNITVVTFEVLKAIKLKTAVF